MRIATQRLGWFTLGILGLTGFSQTGCDSRPEIKSNVPVAPVSVVDESLPEIVHPEYANWSQFPAQSYVIRKRVVTNANGEVIVTSKMWLESKSDKQVEVGSQIKVERTGDPIVDNPSDIVSYPATFRLPKGMNQDQFYRPSAKAKEVGEETITIGDQSFQTKVYEWEENNEAGPMTVKLWRSDSVPGRIVRQELFTKSSKTTSSEQLIEVNLKGNTKPESTKP